MPAAPAAPRIKRNRKNWAHSAAHKHAEQIKAIPRPCEQFPLPAADHHSPQRETPHPGETAIRQMHNVPDQIERASMFTILRQLALATLVTVVNACSTHPMRMRCANRWKTISVAIANILSGPLISWSSTRRTPVISLGSRLIWAAPCRSGASCRSMPKPLEIGYTAPPLSFPSH